MRRIIWLLAPVALEGRPERYWPLLIDFVTTTTGHGARS